ncbi:MAG: hypothetical protein ACPG5B_17710 [Chitinophagales bacterium]
MKKSIFIIFFFFSFLSYGQKSENIRSVKEILVEQSYAGVLSDTFKLSIFEMNIPELKSRKEKILKAKDLIIKKKISHTIDSNAIWSKIVVRVVDNYTPNDLAPFDKNPYQGESYWDSISINYKNKYFLTYLFDLALQDSLNCYSHNMKTKYTNREIQGLLRPKYNQYISKNGDKRKLYSYLIDPDLIRNFILIEYWEQKKIMITKKIIAVSPIFESYDDSANYKGDIPLCWFLLDEL